MRSWYTRSSTRWSKQKEVSMTHIHTMSCGRAFWKVWVSWSQVRTRGQNLPYRHMGLCDISGTGVWHWPGRERPAWLKSATHYIHLTGFPPLCCWWRASFIFLKVPFYVPGQGCMMDRSQLRRQTDLGSATYVTWNALNLSFLIGKTSDCEDLMQQ